MATEVPLTVNEGNDETVLLTVNRIDSDDDLTAVDVLEFVLKADRCAADAGALVLSSTDPAELLILTHSPAQITAEAYIPASALAESYPRWYRVDGLSTAGARRTALFGLVTVTNL